MNHYSTLDTIPYKLFLQIAESGDVSLLSDTETDTQVLNEIWEKMHNDHLSKNQTTESKKIFKLSKKIDEQLFLNKVMLLACAVMRFEFNQEVFDIITSYGYKLSITDTESYHSDIEKIERESNAYNIKAENYKNMLPEPKEVTGSDYNVDDVMSSYSLILGYNIGKHNEITYSEYYAHQKSVNNKIESLTKQNSK